MPAHNVNTAALEELISAAKELVAIKKALGTYESHVEYPNQYPDGSEGTDEMTRWNTLDTSIGMMERVLELTDPKQKNVKLPNGRKH